MERVMRIGLTSLAWKAKALPLSYTRKTVWPKSQSKVLFISTYLKSNLFETLLSN